MSRPASRTTRTTLAGLVAGLAAILAVTLATSLAPTAAAPARAVGNVVTPGDFTGYGFDQCLAPTQKSMNTWLKHSPFLAVGIYISGDSRACRSQPNLTTDWVSTQLAKGWRLLPITLGPQASCQPRFPRYGDDETIKPKRGKNALYNPARKQGTAEATKAVAAAQALGIVPGSTLWYDLEGFNMGDTDCRESALAFLSAWTQQLHVLKYVSGVYSSAGSGIAMLDKARVNRPSAFALPDQIWIARWDGVANTSTSYIREDGWRPHARIKQYQGGHDETWGNVRINIDRNFLDLGRGSVAPAEAPHCKGVVVSYLTYVGLRPATETRTPDAGQVQALQCLLKEHEVYAGKVNGSYSDATIAAAKAWQQAHGFDVTTTWSKRNWMSLLIDGTQPEPVVKLGSVGDPVRRLQRALNAASPKSQLAVTGVLNAATTSALKAWQDRVGLEISGVVATESWKGLRAGLR
ncbi:MAG: Peptidoglycan-binding domain 1 protein [Nocardioides sp.]|jgi:peptidoglycan hydrolase-like protein with peptidoglycan-binding domain|nr:Peptidoglycan-binding domain 1 protein [Nocardioides sp.]